MLLGLLEDTTPIHEQSCRFGGAFLKARHQNASGFARPSAVAKVRSRRGKVGKRVKFEDENVSTNVMNDKVSVSEEFDEVLGNVHCGKRMQIKKGDESDSDEEGRALGARRERVGPDLEHPSPSQAIGLRGEG